MNLDSIIIYESAGHAEPLLPRFCHFLPLLQKIEFRLRIILRPLAGHILRNERYDVCSVVVCH